MATTTAPSRSAGVADAPAKTGGRKIDGSDPAAAAREILKYIREEAKAL